MSEQATTAAHEHDAGSSSRRDWVAPAVVGVVLLAVYLRTMARTAVEGDSAELVATVHTVGILHPTGYPLFAIVGKLFDLLVPIGTVAFRLNLFSALLGVATGAVIAWAYRAAGGARSVAVLAGLAAGLLAVPWEQALTFEVYTLHTLFSALALLAFILWRLHPTSRRLVALAGLGGLALSHHGTAMFVVVPLFVAALAMHRPLGLRLLAKCAGLAILPFVAYAYLPIVSLRDPYVRWGDASTLSAFKDHVTGEMFRAYLGSHGAERMEPGQLLAWFVAHVGSQLTLGDTWPRLLRWPCWALAWAFLLAGWLAWWRRDRVFWACTTATLALSLLWVSVYRVLDQEVFLIACFTIFGMWLASGAEMAAGWIARFSPAARRWVLVAFAVGIPLKLAAANLGTVDQSGHWEWYDRMRLVLHHLRPNAVAILRGHAFHSMALYLQQCEGMRPDVAIVSSGLSSYPWYITKHTDPAVVQGIRDALPALVRDELPNAQLNWCPYLTTAVARIALPDRPVYVNQRFEPPPGYWLLGGPPIEEMATVPPELIQRRDTGAESAKLTSPLGLALLEIAPQPARVRPGDFFQLGFRWRCERAIEQPVSVHLLCVLRGQEVLLTPQAVRFLLTSDERLLPARARKRLERVAFAAGYPLLHGLLPIEPNATDHHYERVAPYVAQSALRPGRYRVYLQVGAEGRLSAWTAVSEITVVARNGG